MSRINFPFMKWNQLQRCPVCDEPLTGDSINIQEGVALCPGCQNLSRLSELNYRDRSIEEVLQHPPQGCSIDAADQRIVVTASLWSFVGFAVPVGIALFWNGIVSIFVLMAAAGLYSNLIGPLPVWFPAPGLKNGKPEMDGHPMQLSETLFLCLFLTPFVVIGTGIVGAALLNLIGKVEVVIDEINSYVATGIGFLKWKTRFDPRLVRAVKFSSGKLQSEDTTSKSIEFVADPPIKFGSLLRSDRMEWMWAVMKTVFGQTNSEVQRRASIPELSWLKTSR